MIIVIPNNNINERKYIIEILLGEFLGINYEVKIKDNIRDYEIILKNKNKLIIEDKFFNKFLSDLEYLKKSNVPVKIKFGNNRYTVRKDIPIIYGEDRCDTFIKDKYKSIICGIDIFASSFFMLTRWEEYVNEIRDEHNRFPAYESLAFRSDFLDRPVVNEYTEMLWNMLKFLGYSQERKRREFKFVLTHDVDNAFKYINLLIGLREVVGDVIKRKDPKSALSNIKKQVLVKLGKLKDLFDTYDYLMDISERVGVKSYFFLHSSNSAKEDVNNDKYLKVVSRKIKERGHFLGYHPSYDAYDNIEIFKKDKERIEDIVGQKLTFGRQHFLRFKVPTTWQIWEKNKMEWDSTLSYADKEGFRCGVCYPYSVFDILVRKKLKLKERPLIVMDGSLINYQPNLTPDDVKKRIKALIDTVKEYNGEFVFLWHNSSFNNGNWLKFYKVYEEVLLQ